MPNRWSKQVYIKGFDCEYITLKKAVNMFERMEISESIYKGVEEPYLCRRQPCFSQKAKDRRIQLVMNLPREV